MFGRSPLADRLTGYQAGRCAPRISCLLVLAVGGSPSPTSEVRRTMKLDGSRLFALRLVAAPHRRRTFPPSLCPPRCTDLPLPPFITTRAWSWFPCPVGGTPIRAGHSHWHIQPIHRPPAIMIRDTQHCGHCEPSRTHARQTNSNSREILSGCVGFTRLHTLKPRDSPVPAAKY